MPAPHTISHLSYPPAPTNTHGGAPPGFTTKRKRKPAGTPDPDAEVVYLSPKTLMESERYVCEVCSLSFQREQNLQMHRRRHKLPWSLQTSGPPPPSATTAAVRKRVYVCPEASCVHHEPAHALGDLVGIKKHFRRKHTKCKQWVCEKCSKGYAVQSDYNAHLKTCGTRGHSCDCGRVFSRVETFIEHQDSCKARRKQSDDPLQTPNPFIKPIFNFNLSVENDSHHSHSHGITFPHRTLELQELFPTKKIDIIDDKEEGDQTSPQRQVLKLRNETRALLRAAMDQRAMAAEKRKQAKCLMEIANQDLAIARKIREQAIVTEIRNSQLLKDYFSSFSTCNSCKINCREFKEEAQKVNYCYFAITQGENGNNNSFVFQ